MFSKKIINALVGDIAANKASLISKDTLKTYLDARYFPNMPMAIEIELFRALWKFCFKLRNADTDAHRDINVAALGVICDRNPAAIRAAIDGDQAYFSDVGPDAELLIALIGFLIEYPALYASLNSVAQILIKAQIDANINLKLKAIFLHVDFAALVTALTGESADAFDVVIADNWMDFLDSAAKESLLQEACEIAILNYGKSGSYDDADTRFGRFIAAILDRVDATRMTMLLDAIENNSQTYDRWRAKTDHRKIATTAATLSVATTTYPKFTANI